MEKTEKNNFFNTVIEVSEKIEKNSVVRIIRNGLVTMIPVLMIGAFALILQSLPITFYQQFITTFLNGILYKIFHIVFQATFGVMSIYMTVSFSISFFSTKEVTKSVNFWGVLTSLICFLIMDGVATEDFTMDTLGAKSVFLAMTTALLSSFVYSYFAKLRTKEKRNFAYGVDSNLIGAMNAIFPAVFTILIATLISCLVTLTGFSTVHKLLTHLLTRMFDSGNGLFGKGLAFVVLSSFLWCFGIHGSDCLQGVSDNLFVPLLEQGEILSKQFFDCFILMGGCGSAICLLIAILIFSKNKGMKSIAKTAAFPMIFNINEIMVFGLPIVFNPVLFIPFILVPTVQYLVAYIATASGLVPIISSSIEWTTPVFLGGYTATGSVWGSILQLLNIIIGVAIYTPFVKTMAKVYEDRERSNREEFISWYKENESSLVGVKLTEMRGIHGAIAKKITLDLQTAIAEKSYQLYYQPQYDSEDKCIGVEALLRWPNISSLAIYPPILIQLAEECGMLEELEEGILDLAISSREKVFNKFGGGIKISVNVTAITIQKDEYWKHLKISYKNNPFTHGKLCIEITEKAMFVVDEYMINNFKECREMGIMFAIDDFAVGQTSINYLKEGLFDMIKLDGSLVLGINVNARCKEIISSLVSLSNSLNITPLAEFVETKDIKDSLLEVGCKAYQGYYYSKAIPLEE